MLFMYFKYKYLRRKKEKRKTKQKEKRKKEILFFASHSFFTIPVFETLIGLRSIFILILSNWSTYLKNVSLAA